MSFTTPKEAQDYIDKLEVDNVKLQQLLQSRNTNIRMDCVNIASRNHNETEYIIQTAEKLYEWVITNS